LIKLNNWNCKRYKER